METGLSLGSNLGDRLANLAEAGRLIGAIPGTHILARSAVYETEPVGVKDEYRELRFLNAVLIADTSQSVHEWFDSLRRSEDAMGRRRGIDRYAPREIDIDLIYFGTELVQSGGLTIPHPHWHERRFVVQPLADVRPDLVLPHTDKPVRDILAQLPQAQAVAVFARNW